MAKETFYFSHDYNARNDRKIAALVKKHKSCGYGIFWATCEMLHEEDGVLDLDLITFGAIAQDLNEDVEIVEKIINDCISVFKLFSLSDEQIGSNRVKRNLDKRQEISKSRSKAGKSGANAKQMLTSAEQKEAKKGKEIKEIKEKKIRGVGFEEESNAVVFEDGSTQTLGEIQIFKKSNGALQPADVLKGEII